MTPVEPGKKAMGRKTADSTVAMPQRALVICPMDLMVASRGDSPSSDMIRSTFSTTTMASSTRRPMTMTRANMVRVLMEKPAAARTPMVPRSTTGTAMVGIRVARMFCRKRNMMRKTRMTASIRVWTTSSMEILTKGVVS
jgi:hypothetical protein